MSSNASRPRKEEPSREEKAEANDAAAAHAPTVSSRHAAVRKSDPLRGRNSFGPGPVRRNSRLHLGAYNGWFTRTRRAPGSQSSVMSVVFSRTAHPRQRPLDGTLLLWAPGPARNARSEGPMGGLLCACHPKVRPRHGGTDRRFACGRAEGQERASARARGSVTPVASPGWQDVASAARNRKVEVGLGHP